MLFDFFNYLYNNDLGDYLDCYSTFLISRKDLKKNVLNIRMNVLIDTYLKLEKKNKFDYYYYYLSNFKDDYMNKPLLVYDFDKKDEFESYDDDIKDHYKFMITKNPVEEIDYDELDRKFLDEEQAREDEKEFDKIVDLEEEEEDDYDEIDDYYYEDYDDYEEYYDD